MKKIVVWIIGLLMLTACKKEEMNEKDNTNRETEIITEQSTRIQNSVVGTWYHADGSLPDGDIWIFTSDGKFETFDEADEAEKTDVTDYYYTYYMEEDVLTIENSEGEMHSKFRVKYTEEGFKLLHADEAGRPELLYESKRQALEDNDEYYHSFDYYESIANDEGFVVEDGVLVMYLGDAKEITIPSDVEVMGKHSMWGENLRTVTIPGTVKVIESAAFHDELCFEYIYIEEGVEEIGAGAFPDLVEIYFPKSVKKMGTDVFDTYEGSVNPDMRIYVKEGSYAHKYFIEAGLEEQLIFEE